MYPGGFVHELLRQQTYAAANAGTCEAVQRVLDFFESEVLPEFDIDTENLYDGASQCTLKYAA